ncbi:M61 family peptidase [Rudanella paleaurantiibacter]|uniref:M61 family peptidase n=1 Tax=Rudanella paleaurantiibacter TaxID=2614655 RepID=A0A7J5U4N5_9BACT|nr:M61 family metallopeptidase [Rudanella paleaurantiibacter]KAB7732681.1 M61 family peptidase [Rudanella paleaurantiibacter]
MYYRLAADPSLPHYIAVEARLTQVNQAEVELQLPAWRPGRYELQHFAKNIQRFAVTDGAGTPLPFRKITKDRWLVQTNGAQEVVAQYNYYANLINAGSSYLSDDTDASPMLYVNPVNLCLYTEGRIHEPCTLELDIPANWVIACGMPQTAPRTLYARDFYELVDCPLIAAPALHQIQYEARGVDFTVWVAGRMAFDPERVVRDFKRFSETQIDLFGEFPEENYHFLTIVLPVAHYHGVEHRNSTVLVLGPADEGEGLYTDLLGVASHELFHAWNVIRIRPAELLPYDFTAENYFPTCFVAEGVTTYYGDLMLRRSGVFNENAYLKELHVTLKRHFEANGRAFQSLTESSWDLWLDGYDKGVPDRKVSVYHKGAIVALILDLHLRQISGGTRSLDDVMRLMWQRFGKPFVGYTLADYRAVTEEVAGESLDWYYNTCIFGNESLLPLLNSYLNTLGLTVSTDENGSVQLISYSQSA